MTLYTCPVLEITPDAQEALDWFDQTHDVEFDQGIPHWRRRGLPHDGAVGSQDAHLMMTLDFLLDVHQTALTAVVRRQQKAAAAAREKELAKLRRG